MHSNPSHLNIWFSPVRCNFSDMEIEMFFAKYDVDGDGEFSYEEGQQLIEDLDNDMIDMVILIDIKYSDIMNILYLSPHFRKPGPRLGAARARGQAPPP